MPVYYTYTCTYNEMGSVRLTYKMSQSSNHKIPYLQQFQGPEHQDEQV